MADDKPTMIMVDLETFNDFNRAIGELADFQNWLISQGDLAASDKAGTNFKAPCGFIVGRFVRASIPTASGCLKLSNKFGDEVNKRMREAKTPEEAESLAREAKACFRLQTRKAKTRKNLTDRWRSVRKN